MDETSYYVPKVHFELIKIKNLVSNQEYQRNLSMQHIHRTAANFDPYQINPVKVSRRDGINYVINGQHTIEIVALASGSRETPVWCMIYDDLSYEHEANIFANQQKYVKSLIPYEVFLANLEAGNDKQLIIKDLVESYHLVISNKAKKPNHICAVSTIEEIYDRYGFHTLDRVLGLLVNTWQGEDQSFSSNILKATAKLISVYGPDFDDAIFIEKVGAVPVKYIIRRAKERRPGSLGVAEAMILEYNGKKKNSVFRLQMNKLYANESDDSSSSEDLEGEDDNDDLEGEGIDVSEADDDSDDDGIPHVELSVGL